MFSRKPARGWQTESFRDATPLYLFMLLLALLLSQTIAPNGVTNGASYSPGFISPGEIISIFGQGLGPAKLTTLQLDKNGKIAFSLAGVLVNIDGKPAPLLFVSSSQLGAIVPYGISSLTPRVSVSYNGSVSPAVTLNFASSQPALFTLDSSGQGQAAALNQDGSINGVRNPSGRGAVISLFGTGEGSTNPGGIDGQIVNGITPRPVLPVSALVGGVPAAVLYAGSAPGQTAGMFQVNVRLPSELVSGPEIPISITVGTKSSPKNVTIAVQ